VDVLSDVISAVRTGRPHSARTERTGPWAVRHEPFAGAGFHLVLEGRCCFVPPDGEPIEVRAGDVVFFPRGSAHTLTSTEAGARTVMLCGAYLMDRDRLHPLLDELPDVVQLPIRYGRHQELRGAIELLTTELEQPRAGGDALLSALLDAMLLYLIRAWLDDQDREHTGWTAALRDPAIRSALHAIHDAPEHPWTVAELGRLTGLSRAAFARRFTTLVGRPPLAYLTWWRMTTAAHHLRSSDVPLRSVAQRVGYTSEYAFATAFKRELGLAPGLYRRRAPDPSAVA
jgi:AraC-like DNA-binding protein